MSIKQEHRVLLIFTLLTGTSNFDMYCLICGNNFSV